MTNFDKILPFCNTPLQTWQSSTCGTRRYQGWLISKLIPQNSDDTEVFTLKREKIEPQMEGSLHITVRGLHKCDCLGILRCCDAPQRFILAGNPDWKLQVLSSLTESCDFQHGLDRGTGNMSEINGASERGGSWPGLPHQPQQRNPPPPTPPCTLKEDVSKWFLFNTMWDNDTSPYELLLACCAESECVEHDSSSC